jgi:hypothetical protein
MTNKKIMVTVIMIAVKDNGEILTSIQRQGVQLPESKNETLEFLSELVALKNEAADRPEFFDMRINYYNDIELHKTKAYVSIPQALEIIKTYPDKAPISEFLRQIMTLIMDDNEEFIKDYFEGYTIDKDSLLENAKANYELIGRSGLNPGNVLN